MTSGHKYFRNARSRPTKYRSKRRAYNEATRGTDIRFGANTPTTSKSPPATPPTSQQHLQYVYVRPSKVKPQPPTPPLSGRSSSQRSGLIGVAVALRLCGGVTVGSWGGGADSYSALVGGLLPRRVVGIGLGKTVQSWLRRGGSVRKG